MDVNSIANLATNMAQERTGQAIGVTVLKKALDAQAGSVMSLINALPPTTQNLPPNLGQNVNTTA
ncbi:MAG: YjfB family protein [Sulfuricellaceae bacterium]|jgi:hypothetical protein